MRIDHFSYEVPLGLKLTFPLRYYRNDQWWRPGGVVFFYCGNEDDVGLYVNHTGLMWENAAKFNALLIFAEHRYYGASTPFPDGTAGCMSYLTADQALADYATLIRTLREADPDVAAAPFVAFGGSYGGMLASWLRMKYPDAVAGAVSASAPIWAFEGMTPPYDVGSYAAVETADATLYSPLCPSNVRSGLQVMQSLAATAAGRAQLSTSFATCQPLQSQDDALGLLGWYANPWAFYAMGNYPYASSYMLHGDAFLPAYPVRAACQPLSKSFADPAQLLAAMAQSVGLYYNASGTTPCFYNGPGAEAEPRARLGSRRQSRVARGGKKSAPQSCRGDWDYQACTQMVMPMSSGLPTDMFWPTYVWDDAAFAAQCAATWGVRTDATWGRTMVPGSRIGAATNIVFSNGGFDPWHTGGVTANVTQSVTAIIIPLGAHHNDLMFADPLDTPDVLWARAYEVAAIRVWVAQHYAAAAERRRA